METIQLRIDEFDGHDHAIHEIELHATSVAYVDGKWAVVVEDKNYYPEPRHRKPGPVYG